MKFNRKPLVFGARIAPPPSELIRNTLGLVNASIAEPVWMVNQCLRSK